MTGSPVTHWVRWLPAGSVYMRDNGMQGQSGKMRNDLRNPATGRRAAGLVALGFYILCLVLITGCTAPSGIIKDHRLKSIILEELDDTNGVIDEDSLSQLTVLAAFDSRIVSLEGIEYCTNLNALILSGGSISNISNLSGLHNLEILHLDDHNISDISVLRELINLRHLGLENNPIEDFSPLADLRHLEKLMLGGANTKTDYSTISHLFNLEELRICNTELDDLEFLRNMNILYTVILTDNKIQNVAPLAPLLPLIVLDLSGNQIVDIGPLANNWPQDNRKGNFTYYDPLLRLERNPLSSVSISTHIRHLRNIGVVVEY